MVLHPNHYWTHVNGEQRVDFVGKVEDFEFHFSEFCNYVGIDVPLIRSANVSEQGRKTNQLSSKYVGRMSRRAIDRINELFAQDFAIFGYERL